MLLRKIMLFIFAGIFINPFVFCGSNLLAQNEDISDSTKSCEKVSFNFSHEPGRIFATPTAGVLKSLDLNLILGSTFGFEHSNTLLGNIALGLGGFADIEVNTGSFLGTLALSDENISTIALKAQVYSGDEIFPRTALGLRASNDWDDTRIGEGTLRTSASDLYSRGLRNVDYKTRISTVYMVLSKKMNPRVDLHGGIGLADIRFKDVRTDWIAPTLKSYTYNEVQKKHLVSVFGGLVYTVNERTQVMFEAQTMPFFDVSVQDRNIVPKQRGLFVGGIRFTISKVLLFDTGIRYQSNYKGLADAQIRLSLSFFFSIPH